MNRKEMFFPSMRNKVGELSKQKAKVTWRDPAGRDRLVLTS